MRITAGHNFGEELRFPDLLRGLLRRDRLGRAARDREVVDWHSPPPALVRQVEPPRVIAPGTGATAFVLADLANSHAAAVHRGGVPRVSPLRLPRGRVRPVSLRPVRARSPRAVFL